MQIEKIRENFKKNDKLCIVGTASTWDKAPYGEDNYDFWGLNGLHAYTDSIEVTDEFTMWFQMHKPDRVLEQKKHFEWLQTVPFPVMMQRVFDEIPTSLNYPKNEIVSKYRPYFESSFAWMFSLAIELGYDRIEIYGVHVSSESEYALQRPNAEYYLGIAEGRGIEVYIPPEADMLKSRLIYGYEDKTELHQKIDHEIEQLEKRNKQVINQMDRLEKIKYKLEGALERDKYYKRVL